MVGSILPLMLSLMLMTHNVMGDGPGDCSNGATCYGLPEGCLAKPPCQVTFKSSIKADGTLNQELSGAKAADGWVAVGFGKTNMMANHAVIDCRKIGDQVTVVTSWNGEGHTNDDITDASLFNLMDVKAQKISDEISCSWSTKGGFAANSGGGQTFSLKEETYILLATGPMADGKKAHHDSKLASTGTFKLMEASSTGPTSSPASGGGGSGVIIIIVVVIAVLVVLICACMMCRKAA